MARKIFGLAVAVLATVSAMSITGAQVPNLAAVITLSVIAGGLITFVVMKIKMNLLQQSNHKLKLALKRTRRSCEDLKRQNEVLTEEVSYNQRKFERARNVRDILRLSVPAPETQTEQPKETEKPHLFDDEDFEIAVEQ